MWDIESHLIPIQGSRQPPLPIIPEARVTQATSHQHQQKQVRPNTRNSISSLSSSVLDLPAVVQPDLGLQYPREREPSADNDWDLTHSPCQPTVHHREAQPEQECASVQPSSSGQRWTTLRDRWRILRPRKSSRPCRHARRPAS
ncbi:hypothetical protein BV22DRAFT_1036734 [Leucogyrophana mollusca]|uniref:Uncharacterized protein n=1 Tax=Leucogyrophana mollusca TaxID=85980 RepID=A0ACB8BEB7_9AGAM|nr:hypothetical protein BV22DRAFT_1036734 [Leucogyrophana mollusca]